MYVYYIYIYLHNMYLYIYIYMCPPYVVHRFPPYLASKVPILAIPRRGHLPLGQGLTAGESLEDQLVPITPINWVYGRYTYT